jgi:hypothetical protein
VTSGDVSPPTYTKVVIPGPPKQLQITAQDTGSGLASILVTASENVSVHISSFGTGATAPVVVTATQIDESKPSSLTLRLTDVAGNAVVCSGDLSAASNPDPPPNSQPGDTVPPTCALASVVPGPPQQVAITAQDTGSGLATVQVDVSANASVNIPSFSPGTTAPIENIATRIDPSQPGSVTLRLIDMAGNVTVCTHRLSLEPNSARLVIEGRGGQATIGVGECITLKLGVRFRGVQEYTDMSLDANTSYFTDPARGTFSSKNVWCATAQEANKVLTIYGRYRDPATGVSVTGTVIVKVGP